MKEPYSKLAKRANPVWVMKEFLSDLLDAQMNVENAINKTKLILYRLTGNKRYKKKTKPNWRGLKNSVQKEHGA